MNSNEMYMDAYGGLDGYRVGGLRVMLVGVVVVVMFAGSIITSIVGTLLPALGVMLAELVAVTELAAPLFLQWLIIRKVHELWDALRDASSVRMSETVPVAHSMAASKAAGLKRSSRNACSRNRFNTSFAG